MRDLLNRILMLHTGMDEEQIGTITDRDFYMTAEEAIEYGIVDKILEPMGK